MVVDAVDDEQWGQPHVPEEVLAGAHLVHRDERERGQEPAEGQVPAIPKGFFTKKVNKNVIKNKTKKITR